MSQLYSIIYYILYCVHFISFRENLLNTVCILSEKTVKSGRRNYISRRKLNAYRLYQNSYQPIIMMPPTAECISVHQMLYIGLIIQTLIFLASRAILRSINF